jgi:hypothetical protein
VADISTPGAVGGNRASVDSASEQPAPPTNIRNNCAVQPPSRERPRAVRDSSAYALKSEARRRIAPEVWATWAGALVRQHDALPADNPRRKPTVPVLAFMRDAEIAPDAAIGTAG